MVAAAAFLVRAAAALASDRVVADVLRYRKLAAHVLDVYWNPYLAPRLYPYPAAWVWFEVAAEWLARHAGVSFALAVKTPVVIADAVLAGVLVSWGRERGALPSRSAWAYALHPVAILVVGFHGQFDSVALLALVCALRWLDRGLRDRSALAAGARGHRPVSRSSCCRSRSCSPGAGAPASATRSGHGARRLLLLPFAVAIGRR